MSSQLYAGSISHLLTYSFRFGEDSMEKMVDWIRDNIPPEPKPAILEVGSGNGALLFAIHEAGYDANHICGVDYSADAVKLARAIGHSRGDGAQEVTFEACDFLRDFPRSIRHAEGTSPAVWDLVLDKGTFDAIALGERDKNGVGPADNYPARIAQVVRPGGQFLITCECSVLV